MQPPSTRGTTDPFEGWVLRSVPAPCGSGPSRVVSCLSCTGASEPDGGFLTPDSWALGHARETGHRTFREVRTVMLQVSSQGRTPALSGPTGPAGWRPSGGPLGPVVTEAPAVPGSGPVPAAVCWAPMPRSRTRNCTLPPGHKGEHHHEYTGSSWPRDPGPAGAAR
jgi:hypothetical protein